MNTYIPSDIALAYPISVRKVLHFVSQDSQLASVFISDILEQHNERMTSFGYTPEDLSGLYEMIEFVKSDIHNGAHIAHKMAIQEIFHENEIDNAYNYIMTLLANGLPIPYDTPQVYLREWSESETVPKYTPISNRPIGYYRTKYTQNRQRGVPNYPEFVEYADEEFLEKMVVERLPPAAPITYRMRKSAALEKDSSVELKCRRKLEDTFNSDFELIRMDNFEGDLDMILDGDYEDSIQVFN